MAEKERKPDDKASAAAPAPGQSKAAAGAGGVAGIVRSTPVLLGAVMFVEAGVLFAGFKFFGGGPAPAEGAVLAADPHAAPGGESPDKPNPKKRVELAVLDFKAPNKLTGRTFLYDVSIYLVTREEHKDKAKQTIAEREATIKDRIRTIVAQSDPDKLGGGSEPGLETLRRQIKYQLDEIVGEGMIDEILIPRCIPYRADF
jgi:flagellar basal body-associated protein FliL